MLTRQSNTLESLHGVQIFIEANVERLGAIPAAGMRRRLDAIVAELDGLAAEQAGHDLVARGTTQKHYALRVALRRDHMATIAGVARAELSLVPEFAPFLMPRAYQTADRLAMHAAAMARAAAPFRDVFVEAGLPGDFLEQLGAASDAMRESFRERAQTLGRRTGATKGLAAKLTEGRRIVRALDRFVTSALRDEPALLANWKTVQRVRAVHPKASVAPPVVLAAA